MRLMRPLAGLLVFAALSASLLISLVPALGQTPGSPVQQILQGLSPEQLNAISQQFGGAGAAGTQGVSGATPRPSPETEEQQNLQLQQQREQLLEQQKQRAENERLSPYLQAEDWVVITIDSNPLPSANAPVPASGVLGALGVPAIPQQQQQQNVLGN